MLHFSRGRAADPPDPSRELLQVVVGRGVCPHDRPESLENPGMVVVARWSQGIELPESLTPLYDKTRAPQIGKVARDLCLSVSENAFEIAYAEFSCREKQAQDPKAGFIGERSQQCGQGGHEVGYRYMWMHEYTNNSGEAQA